MRYLLTIDGKKANKFRFRAEAILAAISAKCQFGVVVFDLNRSQGNSFKVIYHDSRP